MLEGLAICVQLDGVPEVPDRQPRIGITTSLSRHQQHGISASAPAPPCRHLASALPHRHYGVGVAAPALPAILSDTPILVAPNAAEPALQPRSCGSFGLLAPGFQSANADWQQGSLLSDKRN